MRDTEMTPHLRRWLSLSGGESAGRSEINPNLLGVPVVKHRWIPVGTAYRFGGALYIGTYWKGPRNVGAIIALQRRRRR